MLEHVVSRSVTELTYIKRSTYTKDVTSEIIRTIVKIFKLFVQTDFDVPIYVTRGFM